MHNSINIKHGNYYYYVCFANSESAFNHTLFLGVITLRSSLLVVDSI